MADSLSADDLAYLPAVEARRLFVTGELSPVDVTEAVIARAVEYNPTVNALVADYFDVALELSRDAERRFTRREEPLGPLDGVTVAIKDETEVANEVTTSGSLLLRDSIGTVDAPVVERIRAAGGIVHARTSSPEFGCTPFTHSRLWGVTHNPWNHNVNPGGSSGGAGAALASGFTTLADGSDIGGSIRVPAAFCGVVGFKPPYGRVPSSPPYSLDTYNHQGPMARTVSDCALLANVMSGWHRRDPATVRERVDIPDQLGDIRGWRIAYSLDRGGYRVDDEVAAITQSAATALADAGASVVEVKLDWDAHDVRRSAFAHFGTIFGADLAADVAGHESQLTDYTQKFMELCARGEDGREYLAAIELEARFYSDLADIFANHRVLLCPTNAVIGFEAAESYLHQGPPSNGIPLDSVYDACLTTPFNLASRCPVLAVPAGFASNGVPVGVQLVGAPFDDLSPFHAGAALERELAIALHPAMEIHR